MAELRADIDAAVKQMKGKLSGTWGRSLKAIEQNVEPGEKVFRIAAGVRGGNVMTSEKGLMVLTDHKLIFLHEGVVRSSQESIPLDLITGVAVRKGLAWSDIKTTGAQSNETITQVNKSDADAMAADLKTRLAERARGFMPVFDTSREPSGTSTGGVADELDKLTSLRDRGILTEEEFAAQKARILGG